MDVPTGSESSLLVNNGDGRYVRYFADLDRALRVTTAWARAYTGGSLDCLWHSNYLRALGACFNMLRARYTFEANDSFMADLSQSGFPHSYMLARISTDRAAAISEHRESESFGTGHYKAVFLDDLFTTGFVNPALLNRIACAHYAHVVTSMVGTFDPRFMCGEPVCVDVSSKRYHIQWNMFDPTANLPLLCSMVFECNSADLTRAVNGLKLVLRHETSAGSSVASLAERIDTGVADVRPIALTRATVGPMYLPGFTPRSDVSLDTSSIAENEVLVEITVDQTHAVAARKTSSLAVRFGVIAAERQVYAVRTNDPLCYERGAERVERIVILPHRALQHMAPEAKRRYERAYTFVTYTQAGELQ